MAWNRATLATLIGRNQGDLESHLPGTDAKVRRTNLNVLAKLISATAHGLYGNIAWAVKQIFPSTADKDGLDRHATFWLTQPRKPAEYAIGDVTFTGTNGVLIPAETIVVRADGAEYSTDADANISGATVTTSVTAVEAGQAGNSDAATALTLASPIAGINSALVVAAGGLVNGSDEETDEELEPRIVARVQNPPHGGDVADYEMWALEVPGVTRAWVYPQELGAGTVTVRFVRDNDVSIIPDAGEVTAVQAHIDDERPVTANVTVVAPVADPVNYVFSFISPNTQAVKDAITVELADLHSREAQPQGTGVDGTLLLSHIRAAISVAAGENNYGLTSPNADVTHTTGHMATLGTVTFP